MTNVIKSFSKKVKNCYCVKPRHFVGILEKCIFSGVRKSGDRLP